MQPGATRPVGVTEEHLLGQKTAGFMGVAPGITHGAMSVWLLLPEARPVQQGRCSSMRRRSGRGVTRAVIRVAGSNHGPARRNEAVRRTRRGADPA